MDRYKTAMVLDNIAPQRIYDEAFWALLFKVGVYPTKFDTPDKIYDLLLPYASLLLQVSSICASDT